MGGQFLPRHRAGEPHRVPYALGVRQLLQARPVRAAADDQQHRVRHVGQDLRHRLDQGVLALARHQPGDADHHRPVRQPEPAADLGAPGLGVEGRLVHARRQLHHPGRCLRPHRGGDPRAGVLAQVGQHVGARADPAQQLPGAGQLGPGGLVPVGHAEQPPGAGPAQRGRHQAERGRGAEPDRVAPLGAQDLGGPPGDPGCGNHHLRPVPDHRERLLGVEAPHLAAVPPGRGVHHDASCGLTDGHVVHEGLDAPRAGREVIGDDQGSVHLAMARSVGGCSAHRWVIRTIGQHHDPPGTEARTATVCPPGQS